MEILGDRPGHLVELGGGEPGVVFGDELLPRLHGEGLVDLLG